MASNKESIKYKMSAALYSLGSGRNIRLGNAGETTIRLFKDSWSGAKGSSTISLLATDRF